MSSLPIKRFYGIFIPAQMLIREDLSQNQKIILCCVDELYEEKEGGCSKGNTDIANILGLSASSIQNTIPRLIKMGLIQRVSFDGRKRVIRACSEKWGVKRK